VIKLATSHVADPVLLVVSVSGCVHCTFARLVIVEPTEADALTVPVTTIVSDEPLARLIPVRT
jgi:hypothetical protein